jgi:5-methylcytosine-specific restriction endonuclease McrA
VRSRKAERAAETKNPAARKELPEESMGNGRQESLKSAGQESGSGYKRKRRPHIPNAMRHKVWQRDKGRCTHDLGHGHTCGDRYMVEIDHLIPWAKGGPHTVDNLALKCRRHNMLAAERSFGASFMGQFRNEN